MFRFEGERRWRRMCLLLPPPSLQALRLGDAEEGDAARGLHIFSAQLEHGYVIMANDNLAEFHILHAFRASRDS